MRMAFQLTKLDGTPKSGVFTANFVPGIDRGETNPLLTRQNASVTIPNGDSRIGSIQVSMWEPVSSMLTPGDTMVKCLYGSHIILWGIVLQPVSDFDAGTVVASLHDTTIRFKRRFLRYGDASVTASLGAGNGIPLDGSGMRTIIADSERPSGLPPGTGVLIPGINTVTPQPAFGTAGALYAKISRGDNSWDSMHLMTQAADGFEADFRPFDADHPSLSGGAWAAGLTVELITKPLLGTDRSQGNGVVDPVVFVHGRGGFHLTSSPDATAMRNYAVQVQPGGPADPLDIYGIAKVRDDDSITQYGIWEDWQSAGQIEGLDVLTNRAVAVVTAYADPPQFFTAKCDTDTPCGYQFMQDFDIGDIVSVAGKVGYCSFYIAKARITQLVISQKDQDGNVSIDITFAPFLLAGPHQVIE